MKRINSACKGTVRSEDPKDYVTGYVVSPAGMSHAELVQAITGLTYNQSQQLIDTHGMLRLAAHNEKLALGAEFYRRALFEDIAGAALTSPTDTRAFVKSKLRHLEHEVFCVMYLDNRHRVLGFEEMFRGTIDGASVHPREVAKACLNRNAAAVILVHNHPSGVSEPSAADRAITRTLTECLGLLDVRVLDHLVVGVGEPTSMAERGLI